MTYTTEKLKILREQTGAGINNCKTALIKSNGDIILAIEILRKEGLIFATKKSHRLTEQGIITSYIHTGGKIGVLIQLNCETDFVAKRIEFQTLAKNLAMQIVAFPDFEYISIEHIPQNIINEKILMELDLNEEERKKVILTNFESKTLLSKPYLYNTNITVEEHIKAHIALLGENIQIAKFSKFVVGE